MPTKRFKENPGGLHGVNHAASLIRQAEHRSLFLAKVAKEEELVPPKPSKPRFTFPPWVWLFCETRVNPMFYQCLLALGCATVASKARKCEGGLGQKGGISVCMECGVYSEGGGGWSPKFLDWGKVTNIGLRG